jgi:hypothetical protein
VHTCATARAHTCTHDTRAQTLTFVPIDDPDSVMHWSTEQGLPVRAVSALITLSAFVCHRCAHRRCSPRRCCTGTSRACRSTAHDVESQCTHNMHSLVTHHHTHCTYHVAASAVRNRRARIHCAHKLHHAHTESACAHSDDTSHTHTHTHTHTSRAHITRTHNALSSHGVPAAAGASGGHTADTPCA